MGDAGGERNHLFARRGRLVARPRSLEQSGAERVFDRAEAAAGRRMGGAERLGGAAQRTRVGDRLHEAKLVPAQGCAHCRSGFQKARRICGTCNVAGNSASRIVAVYAKFTIQGRGAAARRRRSLIAAPSPCVGIGPTPIVAAPEASTPPRWPNRRPPAPPRSAGGESSGRAPAPPPRPPPKSGTASSAVPSLA